MNLFDEAYKLLESDSRCHEPQFACLLGLWYHYEIKVLQGDS